MKHAYKFKYRLRPAWLLLCGLVLTALPTSRLAAHVAERAGFPDCSITLHVDNQEVKNVLAKIQQQCDVRFTYSSTVIPATRKVSLSVTNRRLDQVLSEFLPTCNIDYRIENRQVILFKAEKSGYAPVEAVPALAPVIEMMSISGRITDGNGEGLPGVTIRVKDTNGGTSTDGNGAFTLETPENSGTLVLSYTGYVSQEVPFNETTRTFNLVMQTDEQALSEVVVIGYQTVRKRDLTGSASVVDTRESKKLTATNLQETLQGLSSGVAVSNSGRPGDMPRVNIRGLSSFSGDSRPLY
ncbi:MAG: carboxypeptidase-like regulatory domain-containing protein, partial [Saprospiraceae bacterium]|nr:carboxypeptidase-like regulatory domain-containing protein [Saprospiraceae bacterium]